MALLNSTTAEAGSVEVLGQPLRCLVCGNGTFFRRAALLNSRVKTFFKLDWTDPKAECVICGECGHIHWFIAREGNEERAGVKNPGRR